MSGEYVHFRCVWHAVDGYFDPPQGKNPRGGFWIKCEVMGCGNRGLAYWYRGPQFQTLPQPTKLDQVIDFG